MAKTKKKKSGLLSMLGSGKAREAGEKLKGRGTRIERELNKALGTKKKTKSKGKKK